MGPLPETIRGNKHLLVVMDHFTKWCEVFPTQNQRANTVAGILVNRVFSRFGPPTIIHSDQGRLAAFVSEHKDDLDSWISLEVYAYNTSCHESTVLSPYELVFGRSPRTPLELDLDIPLKHPFSQSEYSQSVRKVLHSLNHKVRGNVHQNRQKQQNSQSSVTNKWSPFIPGSSVWLRRPKSWKFGGRWIGPYEVLSRQGVNYRIGSKVGKEMVAHHDNLKLCVVSISQGVTVFPVPESMGINFAEGNTPAHQVEMNPWQDIQQYNRPARLRQNIQPPLRFGEYVTH